MKDCSRTSVEASLSPSNSDQCSADVTLFSTKQIKSGFRQGVLSVAERIRSLRGFGALDLALRQQPSLPA